MFSLYKEAKTALQLLQLLQNGSIRLLAYLLSAPVGKIGGKLGETQEHNIAKKIPKVHEMAVYMVNIASKIK